MNEKAIERYLIRRCRERGWWPLKFNSTSEAGMPDRLVLLPGGVVVWIELKASGKKPRDLQRYQHARLEGFGFRVFTASSKAEVDKAVKEIEAPPLQKIVKAMGINGKRYELQEDSGWREEENGK